MGGAEESAHPESSDLRGQTSTHQQNSRDVSSEQAEVARSARAVPGDGSSLQQGGEYPKECVCATVVS